MNKKRIISIIALIIVLIFVVGSLIMPLMTNASSTMSRLQDRYSYLEKRQKQVEQQIQDNKSRQADAAKQQQVIDQNIDLVQQQIVNLNEQIENLNEQITQKQREIDAANKNIQQNYQLFKDRLRAMYEVGNVSYIDVLFSSTDITDFLNKIELLKTVSEHDKELLAKLQADEKAIEDAKKVIEQNKKVQLKNQANLNSKHKNLDEQMSAQKSLIAKIKSDNKQLASLNDQLEKQMAETDNAIAKLAAESTGSYTGGQFLWPIQGMSTYISSPFGPRTNPYTHKTGTFHEGIDIAGGSIYGHPILAANSGVVKAVVYGDRAYGNYVIVDHGGGIMTFYGHSSAIASGIAAGVSVTRGQTIAYVGSTGWSTGPHLHFGVLNGGKYVNPLNYTYGSRK